MSPPNAPRRGTVIILVSGVVALMATLALAFLARMRSDVEETGDALRQAQCRLMLSAAMCYVLEGSRVGYDRYPDTPSDAGMPAGAPLPVHEEAFGWIDVRDGSLGPRTQEGRACFSDMPAIDDGRVRRPAWPAPKGIARCPMFVPEAPPYAIRLTASYNPMDTSESPRGPWFCYPLARHADPQPHLDEWNAHVQGDPRPRAETVGKAWFRVLRDGPATFLITVGSGGTHGFRDWREVDAQGEEALFGGDRALFTALASQETRLWYRIEWSAAVIELTYDLIDHEANPTFEHYLQWPLNASHTWCHSARSQTHMKNHCATIRWVQRLLREPTWW